MKATLSVALVTLGDPGRLTGGYLYHRRMAELASQHAARLTFFSLPERPFTLPMLDAPAILRRVQASGASALVLDSIAAAFLGPWLLLRPPGLPLLGMLHQPPGGVDHDPVRFRVQALLDHAAYRRARLLVVASASLGERLRAEGVPAERLRVVPPGRDLPPPAALAVDRRQGRRVALLCVGNWLPCKGIDYLLAAVARLPAMAATLHLAGDDRADRRYAGRLRRRLARPDLAGRVVVHGPVPAPRLAALYQAADVFVLPGFKETYGTVYGEAMAAGLPVVGWRAGHLPHLAEHGRHGLLVPPGDVAGLSQALARLIEDEPLRQAMGDRARQRAAAFPTWAASAAGFFQAVQEVVERRDVGLATGR